MIWISVTILFILIVVGIATMIVEVLLEREMKKDGIEEDCIVQIERHRHKNI